MNEIRQIIYSLYQGKEITKHGINKHETTTWKNIESHTKIINIKYQLRHRMKNSDYL